MVDADEIIKGIQSLHPEEAFNVLDRYINESQALIDALTPVYKETLKTLYEDGSRSLCGNRHIARISTTRHTIVNEQLYLGHKDLYSQLADKGVLVLPAGKASLISKDAPECVLSTTNITYQIKADKA